VIAAPDIQLVAKRAAETQHCGKLADLLLVAIARANRKELTSVDCRQISARIVLLQAEGHVTRLAMSANLPTFEALIKSTSSPDWIIDISKLGNFEPGAVAVGADYFRLFRQAGGAKVVLVSGLATARLAAFTIAFAAHVPLVPTQSLAEACKLLGVDRPPAEARSG